MRETPSGIEQPSNPVLSVKESQDILDNSRFNFETNTKPFLEQVIAPNLPV